MIIVSGTGRCGTSMWMQVLSSAGLPVIGEAFPERWQAAIGEANPRGFFESSLIGGINFTSNPNPISGVYLKPEESRDLVVKIFLVGLHRTEQEFLNRVLVSVREWRSFGSSAQRMNDIQIEQGTKAPHTRQSPEEYALKWWRDHLRWLQDQRLRAYPCRAISYESVLAQPSAVVPDVLEWLGAPCDVDQALATIEPKLQTQRNESTPDGLQPTWVEAFDELYQTIHLGQPITDTFIRQMETINQEILEAHPIESFWARKTES